MALGIIEALEKQGKLKDILEIEHNSAEWACLMVLDRANPERLRYLHVLIEAVRLAFADTRFYVNDPEHHPPVKEMLSAAYLDGRAKLIYADKALGVKHGNPTNYSDTTYFSVTDQDGNACSFIISNSVFFGTAAVPTGCGFSLQNRGSNFWLEDGHPNNIEGGKRPYHTIIPGMATLPNGELLMSFGVMGGFNQPQGHVQTLLNILKGMDPQKALDAPRFCIDAESFGTKDNMVTDVDGNEVDSEITTIVDIEEGVTDEVLAQLGKMGHRVRKAEGWKRQRCGRGQIVQRIPTKVRPDRRRERCTY
jgi:gamma-glutamyltranspeptidase/glutathione hydrolase